MQHPFGLFGHRQPDDRPERNPPEFSCPCREVNGRRAPSGPVHSGTTSLRWLTSLGSGESRPVCRSSIIGQLLGVFLHGHSVPHWSRWRRARDMKRSAKGDEVSRVRRPSGPAGRVDCQNRLDQTMGNHGRTPKWRLRSSRLAPCTRPTVGSRGIVRWIPDGVRILEGGKPAHFREVPAGCFETRPGGGSGFASLQDPPAAVHAAWTDSPQEGVPFGSVGAGLFPGPLGSTPFHCPRDQIGAQQGVVRHRARPSQGSSVTGPTDGARLHTLGIGSKDWPTAASQPAGRRPRATVLPRNQREEPRDWATKNGFGGRQN